MTTDWAVSRKLSSRMADCPETASSESGSANKIRLYFLFVSWRYSRPSALWTVTRLLSNGRAGFWSWPMRSSCGSISTASMCWAPCASATVVSLPVPAPMIRTFFRSDLGMCW